MVAANLDPLGLALQTGPDDCGALGSSQRAHRLRRWIAGRRVGRHRADVVEPSLHPHPEVSVADRLTCHLLPIAYPQHSDGDRAAVDRLRRRWILTRAGAGGVED